MSTSEVGECTATPEYLRLEGEFWRTVGAAAVVVLPPCVQSEEDLCHSAKRCARQVCAGIRHSVHRWDRAKGAPQGRLTQPALEVNRMWSILSAAPWNRHRLRLLPPGHHRISFT